MKELEKKIKTILKEVFSQYGFKKKANMIFQRDFEDAIQGLIFGHSTHGEAHVRYLTFTAMLSYPSIDEIMTQLDDNLGRIGINIGYLMPEKDFKEWRFASNDSDEYIRQTLDSIVLAVSQYALTFLDKYSTINELTYGLESGNLRSLWEDRERYLPIIYYMSGNKKQASLYIDNAIKRRINSFPIEEYKLMQEIHGESAIQIPPNKALDSYMPFAENFKERLLAE